MPVRVGDRVAHYEILERIGDGPSGAVYKARDLDLERLVTLRTFSARQSLIREASLLTEIDHPHVCPVYEVGHTPEGDPFLVAGYCEGETLARRLARGPLKPAAALDLAAQIAAGLACAHERGIVHGNLRPSNVFVSADGQAKIVDFGFAGAVEQTLTTPSEIPAAVAAYAAPEQLRGERADARTDVWSLGAILYEMLTGQRPEALSTPAPPGPAGLPPGLEGTVARALALQPADRYPSAEAMRRDLRGSGAPETSSSRLLGPYRLLDRIGGGGMGVVYRAEDTRLGRTVAVKLLPPELTRDLTARARFQQEARAASALDHPNICTLYDVGETPEGQLYLTMPCYEGETLRQRLERGPLPLDEAVDVARQAARGLAKAHARGIVHRDVKPANLMLTTDGVVKILDFGIAKLADAAGITRTGGSVGTPAYMSPEQMRGEEVDVRTDLWSLGVVLYEMLAGRRPFPGDHPSVVQPAVLFSRPEPLGRLRPEVPVELRRIVEGLLVKDPGERSATAESVLASLGGTGGSGVTTLTPPARRRSRAWLWGLGGGLALAALAGLAAFLWIALRPAGSRRAAPPQARFARLTEQQGRELFPSISPRGDLFAYAAQGENGSFDVYLQRVGGGKPINLTADSPVDDTQPAFSPDGSQIAFRSDRNGGGIFLMGATGESVRRLVDSGYDPAWSPDGREIAFDTSEMWVPQGRPTESRIWRVEIATGRRRPVAGPDAIQPSWSPHGRRIAYWGLPHGTARRVVWTVPAGGGTPVTVIDDGSLSWNPVWSPDGRFLYFASDRSGSMNLWRVPIDEESGEVQGEPQPVTSSSQWCGPLSISRDGKRLIYVNQEGESVLVRAPLDPRGPALAGPPEAVYRSSLAFRFGGVSTDGKWLVLQMIQPQEDLYLVGTDGNGFRQITQDTFKDRSPVWAPDGSIVFFSDRGGRYEAWSIRPDGSGLQRLVRTDGEPVYDPIPSPDGRWLAYTSGSSGGALADLTQPPERRVPRLLATGGPLLFSSWSPDSRRLAGNVEPGGLFVFSLLSRTVEKVLPAGQQPIWIDGAHLLYRESGRIRALDLGTRSSREILAPTPGSSFTGLGLTRDRKSLFLLQRTLEGDVWALTPQEGSF